MSKPTTIKDIAAHVGVSNMTVSAVLGGGILKHVGVSQATRGRVLEAATSMQYRPNRAARLGHGNQEVPWTPLGVFRPARADRPDRVRRPDHRDLPHYAARSADDVP